MKMLRWIIGAALALAAVGAAPAPAAAQNIAVRGWCEAGATPVLTSGLTSQTLTQASFPACTVTVNITGGSAATIFSDAGGTPLANPFTAASNGQWIFFIASGVTIDVVNSGAGLPAPVTYSSINVNAGGGGGGGGNYQTIQVNGTAQSPQPILNLLSGATCVNDPAGTRTSCTFTGAVSSVFGRTGDVIALTGDYNFGQLTGSLACSQMPALTGDVTSTAGTCATTVANGVSLSADNTFTNMDRFKGGAQGIPFRDITAYMPEGGCSSTFTYDPVIATASITSGTNQLVFGGVVDFKDGCGVTVSGAGPTATLAMASTATGTTTRSGTLVTFTVTSGDPHLVPGIGNNGDFVGFVSVSGCSDTNFNTTGTSWLVNFGHPVTSFTYNTTGSTGSSATGCTATFTYGYAHGITGSTTYHYKIAAIDAAGGLSAAVGPITVTNGNASLTPLNYNWITWQYTTGARMFAVYSDKGLGGAYSCVNLAYSTGYSDWGFALPNGCPAFIPSTPPAAPTAESLTTTTTAGFGTTTLTLATNASNTATAQVVYEDAGIFLDECVADEIAAQTSIGGHATGEVGCIVSGGRYMMNHDMATDTFTSAQVNGAGGVAIQVAGTLVFQSWPWLVNSEFSIRGLGNSGSETGAQNFPTTTIEPGPQSVGGFVVHGTSIDIENFSLQNLRGNGIFVTSDPSTAGVSASIQTNNIVASESGVGVGVPLVIDGNSIFMNFRNLDLIPRADGFPASILFTQTNYGGNGHADIDFSNVYMAIHHVVVDSPGGQNGGQGTSFSMNGYQWSEEHGLVTTGGTVALDTGAANLPIGAQSTAARLAGALFNNLQNADSANKVLLSVLGSQSAQAFINISGDQFITQPRCDNGSPDCSNGNVSFTVLTPGAQNPCGQCAYTGPVLGAAGVQPFVYPDPLLIAQTNALGTSLAVAIPAPKNLTVSSVGSGSLAAGNYCFVVEGLDSQSTPGFTDPSPEVCQTVGATSSVNLAWQLQVDNYLPTFNVYFGSTPGGENFFFSVSAASSTNQSYAFTTISGASSGTPIFTTKGNAYSNWITDRAFVSCLLCLPANAGGSGGFALGIGDPSPAAGSEVSIKNGYLGFHGTTGGAQLGVAAAAGSPNPLLIPTATGTSGYSLVTDGGSPQQSSWALRASISGSITPGDCVLWAGATTITDAGIVGCGSGGSGSGTVTSFSAGNLSPLFTTSVATATVTPALSFSLSTAIAHKTFMNNTGSTAAPGFQSIGEADLPATTVFTDAAATFGAFAYDFSGATLFKTRVGAGATSSASGDIAEDSTAANYHAWNGTDSLIGLLPVSVTPANNDCVKFTVAGSKITLNTAGGGCLTGASANAALSNLSGVAINASLIPGSAGAINIGSNAVPFATGFFGGSANHSLSIVTSALSANRTVTSPDANTVLPIANAGSAGQFLTSLSAGGVLGVSSLTYSGNTTKLVTSTGSYVTGDVATWDANGNAIDGGTAVSSSSTNTFTNKTLSQEGTGNVLTTVQEAYFDAAGCNNATAAPTFDLPASSAPTPNCLVGTNTIQGTLDYDDSGPESGQIKFALPHTWTGAIDIQLYWLVTASGGSNAVKWTIATAFTAGAASYDTAYNAAQTITTNVGANNIVVTSAQSALTLTGSAVDDIFHVKIGRDTTDTFTGTARLLGARITLRKTGS